MIRTRLTLWNAFALAIVLTGLGMVLFASTRASLYRAVDDDLSGRARFLTASWQEFPWHDHHGHDHRREPFGDERRELASIPGVDPVQSRRVAFDAFISHPRVVHLDEVGSTEEDPPWNAGAIARSLKGKRESLDSVIDGHRVRILSFPLFSGGKVVAAGQFAVPLDAADAAMAHLGSAMLIMLPVALIATSITGVWLTRRALRPVGQIAASAGRIEENNLSERLPANGKDEFAELARVFNSMLDRVEGSFRRLEEAYDAQRRFIADASHELKTPLSTIKTRLGVALRKEQTPERYVEHLTAIRGASNSMSSIVSDLLLLARSDEGKLLGSVHDIPLASLADEAASVVADVHGRTIESHVDEGLVVEGDEASVSRVLVNLLDNAARHTPPGGSVEIDGHQEEGSVVLRICDTGVGIPPEDVSRVFERFYRVAAARDRESGGTGLGLAIVRSIVRAHGGHVSLESELGRGTTVTVVLPTKHKKGVELLGRMKRPDGDRPEPER